MDVKDKELVDLKFEVINSKLNQLLDQTCEMNKRVVKLEKTRYQIHGFIVAYSTILSIMVTLATMYINFKKIG